MVKKSISPKLKFQVVQETLTGDKTAGVTGQAGSSAPELDWAVEEDLPGARPGGVCPRDHSREV